MNRYKLRFMSLLVPALMAAPVSAHAQDEQAPYAPGTPVGEPQQQAAAPVYTQEQLDQMLAPIALYPDQLVSEILMASTYPLEVVEAYRWLQDPANAGLQGAQLASAIEPQPWDPSVKSLAAFPQVMKTMNDNLQWTEQVGDAFLANQTAVMNSVQELRQQAQSAGKLASMPQQVVSEQGQQILIQPANPDVIYVPDYNPDVIYGDWRYPEYPPYYFTGYPDAGDVILAGLGFAVIADLWGWDRFDWYHHRIDIDDRRFRYLNRDHAPHASGVWEHNPNHRRGVPYRDATVRARFQGTGGASPEQRRVFRGFSSVPQASAPRGVPGRPQTATNRFNANEGARVQTPARNNRVTTSRERENTQEAPAARPAFGAQESHQAPAERPAPQAEAPAVHAESNHAAPAQEAAQRHSSAPLFESFSRGPEARSQSARGSSSRSSPAAAAPARAPQAAHGAPHGGGAPSGHAESNNKGRH